MQDVCWLTICYYLILHGDDSGVPPWPLSSPHCLQSQPGDVCCLTTLSTSRPAQSNKKLDSSSQSVRHVPSSVDVLLPPRLPLQPRALSAE